MNRYKRSGEWNNLLDGKMRKLILSVFFLAVAILLIYLFAAGELGLPKFRFDWFKGISFNECIACCTGGIW